MEVIRKTAGAQLDLELVNGFTGISEEEILRASRGLFAMEQDGPIPRPAIKPAPPLPGRTKV